MNILLTGSQGYVGSGIIRYLSNTYNITEINRSVFDLRDSELTKEWFSKLNQNIYFDIVIHTAIKGGNRLQVDQSDILDDNIRMYLNLLNHQDRYKKFINIGSGAEKYLSDSFYGLSKKIIASSIIDKDNFYNLRIYGLFDEYEINRRFIKSTIIRYLKRENIIIHNNKYMDFIYFSDFVQILEKYINSDNLPKSIDCVYEKKYNLIELANVINKLDTHSIDINLLNPSDDKDYIGQYVDLGLSYIGLQQGIENTYRNLKNEKGMVRTKQI